MIQTPTSRHLFEEHTSEVLLKVEAPNLEQLFAEAGRAISELLVGEAVAADELPGPAEVAIVTASDREALLVEWLNELVFRAETRGRAYQDFEVESLSDQELRMSMRGVEPAALRNPVKAATYHRLEIAPGSGGYTATVVLDV